LKRIILVSVSILVFLVLFFIKENNAAPPKFTYTSSVIGQGTIEPANGQYKRNWYLTITATPSDGWEFDHWEGDLSGDQNPANLRITSDKHVVAVFTQGGAPTPTPTPTPSPNPTPTPDPSSDSISYAWPNTNSSAIQQGGYRIFHTMGYICTGLLC